jgi:hypothetical protein
MGDGETRRQVTPGWERPKFRSAKLIHAVSGSQDGHLATVLHKSGKLNDEQHRVIREKAPTPVTKRRCSDQCELRRDGYCQVYKHMLDII